MEGTVKWFNDANGYGFISRLGEKDLFVHFTDIVKNGSERCTLQEGDAVLFNIGESGKGPKAVDVEVCQSV